MSNAIDYERIDFQDSPSTQTPLGERNLDKMDQAIYDIAQYINDQSTQEYVLSVNQWIASGDIIYPYYYFISSLKYKSSDHPIAQVWGMGAIETETELNNIKNIAKVIVNDDGIRVYASNSINVDLKLIIKKA